MLSDWRRNGIQWSFQKDLEVLVLPSQLLEEQVYSALEQGQPNRCLVFQMVRRPSQAQDLS